MFKIPRKMPPNGKNGKLETSDWDAVFEKRSGASHYFARQGLIRKELQHPLNNWQGTTSESSTQQHKKEQIFWRHQLGPQPQKNTPPKLAKQSAQKRGKWPQLLSDLFCRFLGHSIFWGGSGGPKTESRNNGN
eukprot:2432724-Amphidinium_carterae.1